MTTVINQESAWAVSRGQRGLLTTAQLHALGFSESAIRHRVARGRLFRIYTGVYAVGRRELSREGRWLAAVLACGDTAALSHDSAAALWEIAQAPTTRIHVSVLSESRSRDDIKTHRRAALDATTHKGIRVTTPAWTLMELARTWPQDRLEQSIGEAQLRGLVNLRSLRTAATKAGRRGAPLRALLAKANLPLPETQTRFGKAPRRLPLPGPGLGSRNRRQPLPLHRHP